MEGAPLMKPKIAIPVPHSGKPEYAQRSLPQYTRAIEQAGGEAVVVPLDVGPEEIAKIISRCHAALLPGSAADVDPQKYGAARHPKTEAPDPRRDTADELLLQDAYNLHKPVFGICYGLQTLNVYRTGTLVQDVEAVSQSKVKHAAGRAVEHAHDVNVDPDTRLAEILAEAPGTGLHPSPDFTSLRLPVNSSHHQAVDVVGDGLRVAARCSEDGTVEALEGTAADHFVLAVQWHPERSFDKDAASRALFDALVQQAKRYARSRREP
jgi:putative glutamine amidotransferase